jgi:hypothetical protein
MKLNSLLSLPAIIAVGIMPIVSISLFDAQPAFSQKSSKQEVKDSFLTPPPATPPVEKKPGFRRPGDGSGSGPIIANPGNDPTKCLDEARKGGPFSAECQINNGSGHNPGNRPR